MRIYLLSGGSHCSFFMGRVVWSDHCFPWSVAYATTFCLGRCTAFVEKLDSKIWKDCDGRMSITPYAADIVYLLFFNILGLIIWISRVQVVTSAWPWACGFRTSCLAVQVGIDNFCTCLVDALALTGAAFCIYVCIWCWFLSRMATGWKRQRTTSRSDENLSRINWLINEVQRHVLTADLRTTRNQILIRKNPKQTRRSILFSPCKDCSAPFCSVANSPRLIQCCHGWEFNVMLMRLCPTPISRRYCVICLTEGDILNETRQRFVGFVQIAILNVSVGRQNSSWYHVADGRARAWKWSCFFWATTKQNRKWFMSRRQALRGDC